MVTELRYVGHHQTKGVVEVDDFLVDDLLETKNYKRVKEVVEKPKKNGNTKRA